MRRVMDLRIIIGPNMTGLADNGETTWVAGLQRVDLPVIPAAGGTLEGVVEFVTNGTASLCVQELPSSDSAGKRALI